MRLWCAGAVCAALGAGCASRRVDAHLVAQLDAEVAALAEKNRILTEQMAACDTPPEVPEIYKQLKQVFTGTEVVVSRDGEGARVTLPTVLIFPPNSLDVRQESAMVLDLLATAIKLHPELRVWIVGHVDAGPASGSLARAYPSAWEWSTAQALAVMKALHGRYQVPMQRFGIGGRGATEPISTEDTPEAKARNRRIEVKIGPADR